MIADGEIQAFERPAALPRAWWVPRERDVRSADGALSVLTSPGFDPRQEVILERAPGAQRPAGRDEAAEASALAAPAQVSIEVYAPEQVEISVVAPRAGWLVLSDLHYPGWGATVNGDPAPIERANHLFRAVRVEAGSSTVRFEYRPASLRRGAFVSLASALLLLALFLRGTRGRARGPAAV
jgi:hypothetical protein